MLNMEKKFGMVVKKLKSLYYCVIVFCNEKCLVLNNGIYFYICGYVLLINKMNLWFLCIVFIIFFKLKVGFK